MQLLIPTTQTAKVIQWHVISQDTPAFCCQSPYFDRLSLVTRFCCLPSYTLPCLIDVLLSPYSTCIGAILRRQVMHCQVLHEYHRYEGQFILVLLLVTGFHLEGRGAFVPLPPKYIGGRTNGAKGLKPPQNSTYTMNNNKVNAFLTRIK